jgi:hypothetical protein
VPAEDKKSEGGTIPPGNQPDFGKLIDLEMLLMPGGTESPLCVIEARIAQRT